MCSKLTTKNLKKYKNTYVNKLIHKVILKIWRRTGESLKNFVVMYFYT